MPAKLGVKIPKSGDGAQSVRQVVGVSVREAARTGPKVDSGAGEDTACGISPEEGVAGEEFTKGAAVILMEPWAPIFKRACNWLLACGA